MELSAEGKGGLEIDTLAGGEIVDHRDAIAPGQQAIHEVGSDESGTACDHAVQSPPELARTGVPLRGSAPGAT